MLKKRIIPIELLYGDRLLKSVNFGNFRDVGHPVKSSQVYSNQDADELIILNIDRQNRSVVNLSAYVKQISTECFVPLSVGGGISTVDDARLMFDSGADKLVINSLLVHNPTIVRRIIDLYGSQSVVASVDFVRDSHDAIGIVSNCGTNPVCRLLEDYLVELEHIGVGEIMLQSISRDGTMQGYDIELLNSIRNKTNLPIIVAGGAGDFIHLLDAFNSGADAVACGSLFNFGDNNPLRAKAYLKNYDVPLKRIK